MTGAENVLYVAKYFLFTVMWCIAPESHTHLSTSLTLFTLTAESTEPLLLSTEGEPMLSVTTDLFLSAFSFRHLFLRWPTFPQWKQFWFSLLSLYDFFDPLGLLDVVLIARNWDFVVEAFSTKALESAAVVDIFNCFSIVHSSSIRLFVVHLLTSSDSQTLLNS